MTGITCRAVAQFVRIVRTVAEVTILRRGFEIDQTARIHMAKYTFYILMPTGQPEFSNIMVEPFTKPIDAVMTSQTF